MNMTSYTSPAQFEEGYKTLQSTFATGRTKSIKWRKWQLKALWWMLQDNEERFIDALYADLHKHPFEAYMEIAGIRGDIVQMIDNVDQWASGEKPDAGFLFGTLSKARLMKIPLGVCLIIGAWNFPMYTLLSPAVAAVAAGNCVVLKPSELAPACQAVLDDLVPKYLDPSALRCATGGPTETSKMLTFKWNHIFYTGGAAVGRIIAIEAAKNLTPTVLELGGKSPVFVCSSANVDLAAKRVANAKFSNSGQICLNADFLLCDPSVYDQFIERLIHWNKEFMKGGNDGFARIVNDRHFDRVSSLLKESSGHVVYGGNTDRSQKYIQPTIVTDIKTDDSLMSQELFGPITPIITADVDRAIGIINSMPHPLGLYIFSNDQAEIDHILNNTTSGGVTINDVMIHAAVPNAPFGGVGESGYGSYHGKYGFDAFSHTRTVVAPPTWLEMVMSFRYPPYKIENKKYVAVSGKSIGKKGETMEDQRVGKPVNAGGVVAKALMVAAVLAVMDSASGGKLLFVHTLKDVAARFRWQK